MRVRLAFFCPRCGSVSFRPSISRLFRDSFLEKLGIHPQRCFSCRRRFYLFKPFRLKAFVAALDRPLVNRAPEPSTSNSSLEASSSS